MRRVRALLRFSSLALAVTAGASCNLDNLGDPPPEAEIYLPTGILLSAQSAESAPRFLYVINSNFDLRYNRGSVQAFDLDELRMATDGCGDQGSDCAIDTHRDKLLVDEVLVPSHATSVAVSPDRRRMYVATRTDPSLLYIDLDENGGAGQVFDCDQSDRRCSDTHRAGVDSKDSLRESTLPSEPVGLVTLAPSGASAIDPGVVPDDAQENFVLVAHRNGQVSLFHDSAVEPPRLLHVLSGLGLEPTGIAFDPVARLAYLSVYSRENISGQPRWLLRVGLVEQTGDQLDYSATYDAGLVVIDGVAAQRDTRAVALNPVQPGELLVASRDPAALLTVDVGTANGADGRALPVASVPTRSITSVGAGPSRMAIGQLGDRQIAAVSCFDGHSLYIVDIASSQVLGVVHNLNGPFELAIDSNRRRIYLADFRASTVQVIDISLLVDHDLAEEPRTDPRILATLGIPKVVQELQ